MPAEGLADIRGLSDFWVQRSCPTATGRRIGMAERLLLITLGLGLEQTLAHFRNQSPDLESFLAWILATAGRPNPETVARYHAWLDGAPDPDSVRSAIEAIESAAPVLGATELDHWHSEGWVILPAAISRSEAAAAEALLWRVVGADPGRPASWYGPGRQGIMVQHFQDPALDVARRSPRIHKAFAQLWGTADLWMTVDRMSFNPPERLDHPFPGPHLHWDASLAPPIRFSTQAMIYLTDTRADQGAFQLVPGFHRRIAAWLESLGDADPRKVDLSAQALPIAADAGDLLVWRSELPHGATPNRSHRPRMAQYVNMFPASRISNPVWK